MAPVLSKTSVVTNLADDGEVKLTLPVSTFAGMGQAETKRRKDTFCCPRGLGRQSQGERRNVVGHRKQRRMENARLIGSRFPNLSYEPQDFIPGPTHHSLPSDFFSLLRFVDDSTRPTWLFENRSPEEGSAESRKSKRHRLRREEHGPKPVSRDLTPCISRLKKALRNSNPGTRVLVKNLDQRIRLFATEAVLLETSSMDHPDEDESPDVESVPVLEEDRVELDEVGDALGDDWDDDNTVIINPDELEPGVLPSAFNGLRRISFFSRGSSDARAAGPIVAGNRSVASVSTTAVGDEEEPMVLISHLSDTIGDADGGDAFAFSEHDDFGDETDTEQCNDVAVMTGLELGSDGNPQMCIYAADEGDDWARFIRFLIHTIAEYYGLESWSLTVQQPAGPTTASGTAGAVYPDRPSIMMSRWRRAYVGLEPTSRIMASMPKREEQPRRQAEQGDGGDAEGSEVELDNRDDQQTQQGNPRTKKEEEEGLLNEILMALPPSLAEIL